MQNLMKKALFRNTVLGIVTGLLAGVAYTALAWTFGKFPIAVTSPGPDRLLFGLGLHHLISAFVGVTFVWLFSPGTISRAESSISGLAYGLLWWILLSLIFVPIFMGMGPQWHAQAAGLALPDLVGYLFFGALVGFLSHVGFDVAELWYGAVDETQRQAETAKIRHRIVIVGGGFAGVTAAQYLERRFLYDPEVAVTLVSNTNHLLFTPMLSEVTAGGVEARHISSSLRAFFRRTEVVRGELESIDLEAFTIRVATGRNSPKRSLPFDHLVLALGAVPNFFGIQGIEENAFTFKTMEDAVLLRNHVIEMLEQADVEPNSGRRRGLMTFVVAGGGFAGAELIGGLNDFIRGSLGYYPNIREEDVRLILVHPGERILPELSPGLGEYARAKLRARGVTFKLKTRVTNAAPGMIILSSGEKLPAETLVWTAGNSPHQLLRNFPWKLSEAGAVKTDAVLRVVNHERVWAMGDCASVVDNHTGEPCPPTAQHAVREAATLAHNIHAVIRGQRTKPFRYRSLGSFAVLGHQTACAEIRGVKFSGLFAWWLWRTIYLSKLPTMEKKIRVALDWVVDIFFPRDIVQTVSPQKPLKEEEP